MNENYEKAKAKKIEKNDTLKKELKLDIAKIVDSYSQRKDLMGVTNKDIITMKSYNFIAETKITTITSIIAAILAFVFVTKFSFIYVGLSIAIGWYMMNENPQFWAIELMGTKIPKKELRLLLDGRRDPMNTIIYTMFVFFVVYFLFIHSTEFPTLDGIADHNQIKSLIMNVTLIVINAMAMFAYSFVKSKHDGLDVYAKFCERREKSKPAEMTDE